MRRVGPSSAPGRSVAFAEAAAPRPGRRGDADERRHVTAANFVKLDHGPTGGDLVASSVPSAGQEDQCPASLRRFAPDAPADRRRVRPRADGAGAQRARLHGVDVEHRTYPGDCWIRGLVVTHERRSRTTSPTSRCTRETSRYGGGFTYTVLDPGIRDVMGARTSIRLKTERTMPKSVLGSGRHAPTLISRCGVLFPTGWRLTPGPSAASCARRAAKPAMFAARTGLWGNRVGRVNRVPNSTRHRENGSELRPSFPL
jgi:hypothetical protein